MTFAHRHMYCIAAPDDLPSDVQAKQRSLREQRQKQWQQIEKKAAQRSAAMQR